MKWFKQIFSRRRFYGDLSEEIQGHLEEKVEELVGNGMSRRGAESAARREFGNVTLMKEKSRDVWRWSFMENLLSDVRYGVRILLGNPGSAGTASGPSGSLNQDHSLLTGHHADVAKLQARMAEISRGQPRAGV